MYVIALLNICHRENIIKVKWNEININEYGYGGGNSTSAEDSSVSSLILVGWCEEGHPATKNLLQLSQG